MKKAILNIFVIFLGLLFSVNLARAEKLQYQDKKLQIENLINEATELIQSKGQAGIDIIRGKNGKFNNKDTYIFITSAETGADIVNPAFEEIEGLPVENYSNPDAKAAQMAIVNAVKDKDASWIEYLWPKPGEKKFSKKNSYVKKIVIHGKARIIGAGFYPE